MAKHPKINNYGVVTPQFWRGETGKALRGQPTAQVLALYLMSCGSANMLGAYYLQIETVQAETGLPRPAIEAALPLLLQLGVAVYDPIAEEVWVCEMVRYRVAIDGILPTDNRRAALQSHLTMLRSTALIEAIIERHGADFHLTAPPSKAPRKPLKSPLQGVRQEISEAATEKAAPSEAPSEGLVSPSPWVWALTEIGGPGTPGPLQAPAKPLRSPFEGVEGRPSDVVIHTYPQAEAPSKPEAEAVSESKTNICAEASKEDRPAKGRQASDPLHGPSLRALLLIQSHGIPGGTAMDPRLREAVAAKSLTDQDWTELAADALARRKGTFAYVVQSAVNRVRTVKPPTGRFDQADYNSGVDTDGSIR